MSHNDKFERCIPPDGPLINSTKQVLDRAKADKEYRWQLIHSLFKLDMQESLHKILKRHGKRK